MMNAIKEETIQFSNQKEYLSVKTKLEHDPVYAAINWMSDDNKHEITYQTEEIAPTIADAKRIKVLLLFKNPHPDSVASGLFFSEKYSKSFWNRFFEVECNKRMLPLLELSTWIDDVTKTLSSGKYDSPFLYYFRCLYTFPTKEYKHLKALFSKEAPTAWEKILTDSNQLLKNYISKEKIKHVIIFFTEGMHLLGGRSPENAEEAIKDIKRGVDQYLCRNDSQLFWNMYGKKELKQTLPDGANIYFNINTRGKNHGDHLSKRYFTYNLEFILKDILQNSPDQNRQ